MKACVASKWESVNGAPGQGCCEELAYHYKLDDKTKIELVTVRQRPSYRPMAPKAVCKR